MNILPELSEKAFQSQVIDYAHLMKWKVAHFRPAMTRAGKWVTPVQADGKGFPDLIMTRVPVLIVAELKVGRNKLTLEQAEWLGRFKASGVPAFVWTPADWPEIERVLA